MSFPADAMAFYRDLELNNTREWWLANKPRYDEHVRGPLEEVTEALQPEFGDAKLFRPHRDVRFSADKSPYKTHQGAYIATGPACGYYVEVNAREATAGGGFYAADADALTRFREAVADDEAGARLAAIVAELREEGWVVGGDQLKTAPRGHSKDHPRIDLLRHKSLHVMREITATGEADFTDAVGDAWQRLGTLVDWVSARLRD
ncbi:hypothetical protein BW730_15595 [Tessaracoccus aquimaris]|uniref:TIGR02453 family protein n=1 Tax=Tessaracoccus aquimaris TaxID=1332264 RepID=A0A1Q2CRM1_9ACTN|nr:DUF2461 domain-containing protein [Tessaracoccus aquimaris]AQP48715.1 hypothetical protein BW730_15595 [Tessaracoccus aquimaris]